jgi:hypothetical protein
MSMLKRDPCKTLKAVFVPTVSLERKEKLEVGNDMAMQS